jgi:multidrug resistance efflux pump
MSESNGHATGNPVSQRVLDSNVTTLQRPSSNGRSVKSGDHHSGTARKAARALKRGPNAKRIVFVAVAAVSVVAAGAGFAVIGNSDGAEETAAEVRVLPIRTVRVEPVSSYQVVREYTGAIVARRTSELGFELAGKVDVINIDEGDRVTEGMALAKIDTEHLETKRRQFVARRAQAAAQLDEMVAGPRDEDIASARARVNNRHAQVELLRLQRARRERLLSTNAISREEYEEVAFGLQAREAQLKEAQHDLEELLNGTRKEQVRAQRAVIDELDAAIEDIDVDIRKSTLKAPFAGTIARRLADEGTVVQAGRPIFRLVEDQALEAWIGLPVRATALLTEDSEQRVRIAARYYDASVAGRFPEVDPATRTRTVVLRLDDSAAEHVVHGQVVRLQLEEAVETSGYWLPSTALTKGARGLWTAFAAVEAESPDGSLFRVERRDVEVLHAQSDRVLVRGTLNSGDRVIRGGTHRVVPGQLVRLAK